MTDKLSGVMHIRPIAVSTGKYHNKGGMTIAYAVRPDGDVRVGFAICSHLDTFNRKLGRNIATSRLLSEKEQELAVTMERGVLEFIQKEATGEDKQIVLSQADSGEYFVPRAVFPLSTTILTAFRSGFVQMLEREFSSEGYEVPEGIEEKLKVVLYEGKLGFHFSENEFGTTLVS